METDMKRERVRVGIRVLVPWGLTQVPGVVRQLYGPPGHALALVALEAEVDAGDEQTVSVPVSELVEAGVSDGGATLTRQSSRRVVGGRKGVSMASKKQSRDVVKSAGGGWDVKQPGKKDPVSHHKTQANADKAAKADLRRAGGGEVRIHSREGKIRDSDTVPPARDPNPPRDKRH